MRIKRVVEADFRRSDFGLFSLFQKENRPFVEALGKNDIVVFVSKRGNQLLFIHGFGEIDSRPVLPSVKYRLLQGSWNPLMLRNYAEKAGMKIDGLKMFEDYFGHLREAA